MDKKRGMFLVVVLVTVLLSSNLVYSLDLIPNSDKHIALGSKFDPPDAVIAGTCTGGYYSDCFEAKNSLPGQGLCENCDPGNDEGRDGNGNFEVLSGGKDRVGIKLGEISFNRRNFGSCSISDYTTQYPKNGCQIIIVDEDPSDADDGAIAQVPVKKMIDFEYNSIDQLGFIKYSICDDSGGLSDLEAGFLYAFIGAVTGGVSTLGFGAGAGGIVGGGLAGGFGGAIGTNGKNDAYLGIDDARYKSGSDKVYVCADDHLWHGCSVPVETSTEDSTSTIGLGTITWAGKKMYNCTKTEFDIPLWEDLGPDQDFDGYIDGSKDCKFNSSDPELQNLGCPLRSEDGTIDCQYPRDSKCAICINPEAPEVCGDGIDNDCNPRTDDNCNNFKEGCEQLEYISSDGTSQQVYNLLNEKFSWIPTTSETEGICCGYNGINDLGLSAKSIDENNYLCLNKDSNLVGRSVDAETEVENWGPSSSLPEENPNPETISSCKDSKWCWVSSGQDQYHIYTIKKPGEKSYDVVSIINQWSICNAYNLGTLEVEDNPFFGKSTLHHFYCYQEGNHWSWAECSGGELHAYNRNGIKGRSAGDSLYAFYLDGTTITSENGVEEVILSGSNHYTFPATENPDYYLSYYSTPENKDHYTFDFSGYDQLEMFVRLKYNDELLNLNNLENPPLLNLVIYGPTTDRGDTYSTYLSRSILGDVVNNPFLGLENWIHLKIPLPNNLKEVSALELSLFPETYHLEVKNIFLSKNNSENPICSGKESEEVSSWLNSFDDGSADLYVNAEEMCKDHYGKNAWLGDDTEIDPNQAEGNCCGNNKEEYYSGKSLADENGKKYGCWNSQPIGSGETATNVDFEASYTPQKAEISYSKISLSGKLELNYLKDELLTTFGDPITFCNQLDVVPFGAVIPKGNYVSSYTDTESEGCDSDTCVVCSNNDGCVESESADVTLNNNPCQFQICSNSGNQIKFSLCCNNNCLNTDFCSDESNVFTFDYEQQCTDFSNEILIIEAVPHTITLPLFNTEVNFGESWSLDLTPQIRNILKDQNNHDLSINLEGINSEGKAYFYIPGKSPTTEISSEDVDLSTNLFLIVENKKIPLVSNGDNSIITQELSYPCTQSECLYPIPGIPERGITIKNLHPDLYELYYITATESGYNEQLISTERTFYQSGLVKAKKVAQQVIFVSDEEESEFFGCNAASYLPNLINLGYCSIKVDKFCSPSKKYIDSNNKYYTTINTWSDEDISEIGYAELTDINVKNVSEFYQYQTLQLTSPESPITAAMRNHTSAVLPARNFLPNPNFQLDGADLPGWELLNLPSDSSYREAVKEGNVTIRGAEKLRSVRIAIPQNTRLRLSYAGTSTFEILLVSQEGQTKRVQELEFSTEDYSYLIIEFDRGTVSQPYLQIIDDFGPAEFSSDRGKIERQGLACCPENFCWNGYTCVKPMDSSTLMVEHISDGRDYRCIAGQWKAQPMQWDWNFDQWGFCSQKEQCFVLRSENQAANAEFYAQDFYQGTYPTCINNTQYIFDHYCDQGNWTTRTKFLAGKLLDQTDEEDFTLYCAPYDQVLLDYGIQNTYLGGNTLTTITTIPSLLAETQTETVNTCFTLTGEGNRLVPNKENTCINNVCLMQLGGKTIFATTLNLEINASDSFLNALGLNHEQITNGEICPAVSEQVEDQFVKCTAGELEGDLWYSPKLKMLIYSKQGFDVNPGIFEELWQNIKDWFASLFGSELSVGVKIGLFNEVQNFNQLYASKLGDKEVHAVREIVPQTKALKQLIIAEYKNYNTPLCSYADINKLNTDAYNLQLLEQAGGEAKLFCTSEDNTQRIEGIAYIEGIDYLWPQLTSKLRIE